jgi:putative CocE/NonD family hydrolase
MLITAGARDQRPVQALDDYGLIYVGAPLTTPLTVAGPVDVVLHVSSDCPDTDFVAKLIERHPDGRAVLLMDGVIRAMYRSGTAAPQPLQPGEPVEVRIHLGDIHHTFTPGSCIEVDVTSSNFPRRARNTNSGHPLLAADSAADIRVANNTVLHDTTHPSFLVLHVAAVP